MANRSVRSVLAVLAVLLVAAPVLALDDIPLRNWTVPKPSGARIGALSDIGYPGTFQAISPCRIVDTRGGAPYTGGPYTNGVSRSYDLNSAGAPCTGIPAGVSAYSINVTVTNDSGVGFIAVYPTGNPPSPLVSLLNYTTGQAVANATVVPCDSSGAITVLNAGGTTDVLIDINGYFQGAGGDMNTGQYLGVTGVWDPFFGGGGVLYVQNRTTGTGYSINTYISNTNDDAAVIHAVSSGATGRNYALEASAATTSVNAAAVHGVSVANSATSTSWTHAGVRGESSTGNGVLGFTDASGAVGVLGAYVNSATGGVITSGILGTTGAGVSYNGGLSGSGTKSFIEPHPTDPTKMIKYICLEGPEAGTYFRGRGRFVGGTARIEVPENFRMVTDPEGLTVQITPMGRIASVGVIHTSLDGIEVESTRDVEFSYIVHGVRKAYPNEAPIQDDNFFRPKGPDARMPLSFSPIERQRLIDNGTYNADGTVNLATAERVGWARQWREEEARQQAAAQRAAQDAAAKNQQGSGQGAIQLLH